MKVGQTAIEKYKVICPFCAKELKQFKFINVKYGWSNTLDGDGKLKPKEYWTISPEAINEREAKEFERNVLQLHLDNKECIDYISSFALEKYRLKNYSGVV